MIFMDPAGTGDLNSSGRNFLPQGTPPPPKTMSSPGSSASSTPLVKVVRMGLSGAGFSTPGGLGLPNRRIQVRVR